MEKRLDKIEDKIDKLDDRLDSIDKTLAVNTSSLVEHIKRTNQLEEKTEKMERHVHLVNGALKFMGMMAGLSAFVLTVLEIIKLSK